LGPRNAISSFSKGKKVGKHGRVGTMRKRKSNGKRRRRNGRVSTGASALGVGQTKSRRGLQKSDRKKGGGTSRKNCTSAIAKGSDEAADLKSKILRAESRSGGKKQHPRGTGGERGLVSSIGEIRTTAKMTAFLKGKQEESTLGNSVSDAARKLRFKGTGSRKK